MIKKDVYLVVLLTIALTAGSCSKNYYSGSGKGSKCGCPGNPR